MTFRKKCCIIKIYVAIYNLEVKVKVYIYSESQNAIEKSGVGRAIYHQRQAVSACGWELVDSFEDADVVHINTVLPRSYFLARKLRKRGIPLVYHAHSTQEDFRNSYIGSNLVAKIFKWWIKKCYTKGDVIITPTPYSKGLLEGYGIKKEIFAISNGIDLDEYARNESAGAEFRKKYGFSDSDKVVMSAGLLIKRKGVCDFAELARRLPQYKFIWFGDANLKFVGKEIRNTVKNPPTNLIFAGYVDKKSLQAALSGSNLFLFPSYEETEGIVVLEALASNIPTLLRNIPVYDGWICAPAGTENNSYFADGIDEFEHLTLDILENRVPSLIENGYEVVRKRSLSETGKQLAAAYERAISICREHKEKKNVKL